MHRRNREEKPQKPWTGRARTHSRRKLPAPEPAPADLVPYCGLACPSVLRWWLAWWMVTQIRIASRPDQALNYGTPFIMPIVIYHNSLERVCLCPRVQRIRRHKPRLAPVESSAHSLGSGLWTLDTGHRTLVRRSRLSGGCLLPAARAALALACPVLWCPFPLLFLTEQPHTYVIPTTPQTTRTGFCPSRSVRLTLDVLPVSQLQLLCCRPGLPVYLPVYLVWSSFVRTSPVSGKPTKPDSNSTFAAAVSCL